MSSRKATMEIAINPLLASRALNDKYYGHNYEFDNFAQSMLLPPGEYTVRIEPLSGGHKVEEKVQIEAAETVVVEQ
jgi:hypothetical protein